jgi:tripartite ATP-independent transporter DctP family solute receptor
MNNKSVSFFFVGLFSGLIIGVAGFTLYVRSHGAAVGNTFVLKLGHVLDPSHPVHKGLLYMAERLKEKSGGSVELQIFPSGVLGSETENIEQVQRSALAITKVSAASMESFIPEMAVFGLPYIFRDEAHYWTVLTSPLGKELLTLGQEKGVRGLCYYDSGSRNFYTVSKPILSPSDLKGQKIRVLQSRISMDMIEMLGAAPTPISWGELYTSLQQGVVDGAENNPPSFYTSRHYEVCKYFSMDEHTRIPDIIIISNTVWDSLSPQVQQWLKEAAEESSVYQRQLWQEGTEEAIKAVQEKGVKIFYPDKAPFAAKVQPLIDRYKGTRIGELVEKIRGVQ